jgi:aspartate carbamoyltransferase catalytic subunit
VSVSTATSSVTKGESLVDTVRTLEALGAEILVMRHSVSGAPYLAAEIFGGHVLNGGDGWHAHPTQALLDLYTMRQHLPGGDLRGRKVAIVGDILHSRVARSNIWSLTAAGADLWLCGPATLLRGMDRWATAWSESAVPGHGRFHVTSDVDAALRDADVVMALRIQRERMQGGLLPSLREYAARFGLNAERISLARPEAIVMHPGPMNEGVEIAPDVAISGRAVITEQVANGVAVRMALLYLLAGAHESAHAGEAGR